jgi:hypothetical protein
VPTWHASFRLKLTVARIFRVQQTSKSTGSGVGVGNKQGRLLGDAVAAAASTRYLASLSTAAAAE